MRIIDAHHHFWDIGANYLPWLADRPITFRYGDYSDLKRNYLPADYRQDAAGFEVIGSVYIETEWDPRDPLGEVAWVMEIREREDLPSVMVAQAWLDREDAPHLLAVYGRTPFVRGIRHKPKAAAGPGQVVSGAPGSMGDAAFRRGFALVSAHGLSYDLQTPWWHLGEAADLAADFPETQIIVNHTGLPSDRTEQGLAGWRAAMRCAAERPNIAVKISGLGQIPQPWTTAANGPIIRETIDIFGADRCMFASNYPVDRLVATFPTIFNGFREVVADRPVAEQEALFWANAARIYRIDLGEGA